jgi:adenine-specific DNA-methyltransferase
MTYRTFQKGNDTLIWGDAIEALHAIPDASVNLIFIDPPYNIGKKFAGFVDKWPSERAYLRWCFGWLRLCIQKLTADGSMYVMASTQSMPMFDLFLRRRLHILSRIVWAYDSSGVQAQRYFGSCYEPILFCVRDSKRYTFNGDAVRIEAKTGAQRKLIDYRKPDPVPYNTTKVPSNVWEMPRVRYRMEEYEEHPSQKPETHYQSQQQSRRFDTRSILRHIYNFRSGATAGQTVNRHRTGRSLCENRLTTAWYCQRTGRRASRRPQKIVSAKKR